MHSENASLCPSMTSLIIMNLTCVRVVLPSWLVPLNPFLKDTLHKQLAFKSGDSAQELMSAVLFFGFFPSESFP